MRLPLRLSESKLAHISLTLVGLMWVLPFLHYRHGMPITSFDQEWWSAMLGVVALALMVSRANWVNPEIPRIVQLPIALVIIVILQWWLGKIEYFDHVLLYVLYLLLAAMLMMLGAKLREIFGMEKLATVLAYFLLAGAVTSALIGIVQYFRWHTFLDGVITPNASSAVYGNIGQPNHYANYVALGLVSLGLLFRQGRMKMGFVLLFSMPLLYVLVLSGSRSAWLYLLAMSGIAWWQTARSGEQRAVLRYSIMLILGLGLMYLMVHAFHLMGGSSSNPASNLNPLHRLTDSTSGGIRFYLWREAVLMFMQSPLFGVGFGKFAWHHFLLVPGLYQSNVVGLYNNAHNLVFQLAAETGIVGLLVLLFSIGSWLRGVYSGKVAGAGQWWGYSVLCIIAIHSMLEYPLWFAYFLVIAAILLGALDETRYRVKFRNAGYLSFLVILLFGAVALVQLRGGYQKLQEVMAIVPKSRDDFAALEEIRNGLLAVQQMPLFSSYAELPLSGQIAVSSEFINEKIAMNGRVLRNQPKSIVAYRQAMLLAQDNRMDEAKAMMVLAIWSFPKRFVDARWQLTQLAEKDAGHFSALLEFAIQKEQEYQRAVHKQ